MTTFTRIDICKRGHPMTPANRYSPPSRPDKEMCLTCHRARSKTHSTIRRDNLKERLLEAQKTIRELHVRIERMEAQEARWDRLEAKLDALARPVVVTHRRIADGGIGGKRERQQPKRAA